MINSLDNSNVYPDFLTTELQDNIWIILFNDKHCLNAASFRLQTQLPLVPGTSAVWHSTCHSLNISYSIFRSIEVFLIFSHFSFSKLSFKSQLTHCLSQEASLELTSLHLCLYPHFCSLVIRE